MAEHPIIFSQPMVRAILDGRKTQTRRVIKPQPPKDLELDPNPTGPEGDWIKSHWKYQTGDTLWVRETYWHEREEIDGMPGYYDDYKISDFSSGERCEISYDKEPGTGCWQKHPSIHMPRWASRITLEIVSVRVERVQDITWEDAVAEGIPHTFPEVDRGNYAKLWDSINAKRGYSWDAKLWVWVIEFKRI